jgi:hypothetical protein
MPADLECAIDCQRKIKLERFFCWNESFWTYSWFANLSTSDVQGVLEKIACIILYFIFMFRDFNALIFFHFVLWYLVQLFLQTHNEDFKKLFELNLHKTEPVSIEKWESFKEFFLVPDLERVTGSKMCHYNSFLDVYLFNLDLEEVHQWFLDFLHRDHTVFFWHFKLDISVF